jgi:hypothetical protein
MEKAEDRIAIFRLVISLSGEAKTQAVGRRTAEGIVKVIRRI